MPPRRHGGLSSLPYTGLNFRVRGVITRTPFTVASNSPKVGKIGTAGYLTTLQRHGSSHLGDNLIYKEFAAFYLYCT
jgi:hypothetical protein